MTGLKYVSPSWTHHMTGLCAALLLNCGRRGLSSEEEEEEGESGREGDGRGGRGGEGEGGGSDSCWLMMSQIL